MFTNSVFLNPGKDIHGHAVGMFSLADILWIADAIFWIVFLLFLLCFLAAFGYLFFAKRVKCSAIFYCSALYQNSTSCQGFSFVVPFFCDYPVLLTSFFEYRKGHSSKLGQGYNLGQNKWKTLTPLPPNQRWENGAFLPFARLHPWFGGDIDGGLLFHFILSKIVAGYEKSAAGFGAIRNG